MVMEMSVYIKDWREGFSIKKQNKNIKLTGEGSICGSSFSVDSYFQAISSMSTYTEPGILGPSSNLPK